MPAGPADGSNLDEILVAAEAARQAGSARDLLDCGGRLERHGEYREAWRALADGARLKAISSGFSADREWRGLADVGGRLLVARVIRHMGAEIRLVRAVDDLVRRGGWNVLLRAEPRLVPLFRRSFRELTVVGSEDGPVVPEIYDRWASLERVAQFIWPDEAAMRRDFRSLRPDATRLLELRRRYDGAAAARGLRGVIGLSWYSTNPRKDLPPYSDWMDFVRRSDRLSVSLQYEAEGSGLGERGPFAGTPLLIDPTVDAFHDLDGLAAQISSTDVVVTISNTTAHLAGALGHPCLVVLDDKDHLSWPATGQTPAFYPSLRLIRRRGRPWSEVLAEAALMGSDMAPNS